MEGNLKIKGQVLLNHRIYFRIVKKYIEIIINKWNDLFALNQSFLGNFVFRGQGNCEWELETSLMRMVKTFHEDKYPKNAANQYEKEMLKAFKWKYPGYQQNPNMIPQEDESIEWLSIMQHFGTKTRLLDFSDSMFVALYMAIYGDFGADAAIWALNKTMIREPFISDAINEGHTISSDDADDEMYREAEDWINKNTISEEDYDFKKLFMVRPRICNERISRQQGLFILPSSISLPFMDILSEYCDMGNCLTTNMEDFGKMTNHQGFEIECGLIKFFIPKKFRYDLTRALQMMNISAETMFPGLEGLGQSVNSIRKLSYEHTEGGSGVIR